MRKRLHIFPLLAAVALAPAGCERDDMHDQDRHEWLEPSEFFADGMSARPLVDGTVAQEQLLSTSPLLTMRTPAGGFVEQYPIEITRGALERGRQRYDIYCAMCHGATGYGDGMIVQRGFVRPPSLHDERLRNMPPGYFVEVITHGYGAMYSYNDRVVPVDRWKIAAYIKTLQLSQNVELASLPPAEQKQVEQAAAQMAPQGGAGRTEPPVGSDPVPGKEARQ